MQAYIFTDLDDTLFQTLKKCPIVAPSDLVVRASLPNGQPNSYATRQQQWLWQWLNQGFKVVPVTGRDYAAFQRVSLPFQEEVVLNHGAVILDKQGNIDVLWLAERKKLLADYEDKLLTIWQVVYDFCQYDQDYNLRLVQDFDVVWYVVIKHKSGTEQALHPVLSLIKEHPYIIDNSLYWHLNGNNFAILPKIINKQDAVSYLIHQYKCLYPELVTFAAGDSFSDAPFMALCDYALLIKNTQLFSFLKSA